MFSFIYFIYPGRRRISTLTQRQNNFSIYFNVLLQDKFFSLYIDKWRISFQNSTANGNFYNNNEISLFSSSTFFQDFFKVFYFSFNWNELYKINQIYSTYFTVKLYEIRIYQLQNFFICKTFIRYRLENILFTLLSSFPLVSLIIFTCEQSCSQFLQLLSKMSNWNFYNTMQKSLLCSVHNQQIGNLSCKIVQTLMNEFKSKLSPSFWIDMETNKWNLVFISSEVLLVHKIHDNYLKCSCRWKLNIESSTMFYSHVRIFPNF